MGVALHSPRLNRDVAPSHVWSSGYGTTHHGKLVRISHCGALNHLHDQIRVSSAESSKEHAIFPREHPSRTDAPALCAG